MSGSNKSKTEQQDSFHVDFLSSSIYFTSKLADLTNFDFYLLNLPRSINQCPQYKCTPLYN